MTVPHKPLVLETGTIKYEKEEYTRGAYTYDEVETKLSVCVANSPHDFYHMYKNGPQSCMSYDGDGGEGQNKPFAWMMKHTLHPMSSMAYNPYIKGLYVKSGRGKTLFRAMTILSQPVELGTKPEFKALKVYSYYTDEDDANDLSNAVVKFLKECGVPFPGHKGRRAIRPKYTIDIPAMPINKELKRTFILPYFDDHTFDCNLRWNEAKGTFLFESLAGSRSYNYQDLYQVGVNKANYKRTLTAEDLIARKAIV